MSDTISTSILTFLNSIEIASKELQSFSQEVQNKDVKIREIVEDFNVDTKKISIRDGKSQFSEVMKQTLKQYKVLSQQWSDLIHVHMEGRNFITQFDSSIIFVVFGNVNVGKSSIGNFIAGNSNELQRYYKEQPQFYVYDSAQFKQMASPQPMSENKFKENYTEETSTIQYYTLRKGLTWVDSPGIHSINGINEELAKKYVEYADLVLFAMSSASPAKYDEFLELKRLMDKEKPLVVMINKSDSIEEDEEDGEIIRQLVAKSKVNRQEQEDYVKRIFMDHESLRECAKELDSISLSVHLAYDALEKEDNKQFEDSGIPRFYERLGKSLRLDAIELKKSAPKQRINSLITDLLEGFELNGKQNEGLYALKQDIEQLIQEIQLKIEEVQALLAIIVEEVRINSLLELDLEVSRLSHQVQQKGSTCSLNQVISNILTKHINQLIAKHVTPIIENFESIKINNINLVTDWNLRAKHETYSYMSYSLDEIERDPKGIIEHIGSFFGAKYTTLKTTAHQIEKEYIVGDNAIEIIEELSLTLEEEVHPLVYDSLINICENYFKQEQLIAKQFLENIDKTIIALNNERM